ncbi:MAG TPA: zf-TFIIB domain-containing protein [bacterium]
MARCQWCTAPLPPGVALCGYCGRRNDVDLQGVHEFTVSVPASPRICPACGVPMQTIDLRLGGTFYIERCERCLSLFFDPNEVETLLEKSTSAVFQVDRARLEEIARGRPDAASAARYYPCPVCRTAMNRVNFGARSGVIVDQCPKHGMWLESGELRRLLEWRKAGGQILDQQRKTERLAEELELERRRSRDAALVRAGAAAGGDGGSLPPLADAAAGVHAFVRTVLRLFS